MAPPENSSGALRMQLVSILTPTRNRERFLRNLECMVRLQTYANVEWIIYDDSPGPSAHFSSLSGAKVRYIHSAAAVSIGEKRNRMAEIAKGEIIAHFDDDDYYAPDYLRTMVERICQGHDLVKFSRWFLYSGLYRMLGYWDCLRITGLHYVWSNRPPSVATFGPRDSENLRNNYLGYGFSYVYRRKVWEAVRFPDLDWNEDGLFAANVNSRFRLHHFPDASGLCLHILHKGNTSRCFPQYVLPEFLTDRLFGAACRDAVRASWE
jgi:glycosyltransferase involved in cell wall biosynthesis